MISAILPFVLSVVTAATPKPAPRAAGGEPAVRVTLNHRTYNRGDRARVTVRVRDDGYVVVLHTDANGHVRVLFPVDPADDNFLKAGQDYEIRARGDRDAFQVTSEGSGTVYAAVSMDPFHRINDFVRNNHWDYERLDDDSAATRDPESAMTNIVEQMADGNHFDYDVATYTVDADYAYSQQHAYITPGSSYACLYGSWDPWCDGYYPSPTYYGGFGIDIGFGFGNFWGYRPYGYYPYGYGFGYGYGYPYYYGGYRRGYGATGYGYSVGRGWSYNHRPITLGPGGGYYGTGPGGSTVWGLGSRSGVGYRNRGTFVSSHPGVSPLYGVSRFNTRPASRGNVSSPYNGGRRGVSIGDQSGFRTRVGNAPDQTQMRPPVRYDDHTMNNRAPERVMPQNDARPTRVETREAPRAEPRSEPRSEPRAEPRSQPRSEPRSEPHSRAPERSGGGGGGGGGGRRGGGGGGGGRRP